MARALADADADADAVAPAPRRRSPRSRTPTAKSLALAIAIAITLLGSRRGVDAEVACAAPEKTLSFSCENNCADAYTPCLVNTTTSQCMYQCYSKIYDIANRFVLLIPYGAWKSPQETAYTATLVPTIAPYNPAVMTVGETGNYSWTRNDNLEKMEALKLRRSTPGVYLTGGSYMTNLFWKGQVSNVEFAADLLTTQTQLSIVVIRNLNMLPYANKLARMFPVTLPHLAINNALLTEFPSGFEQFISLRRLYLNYNFISQVDAAMGMSNINELELVNNQIVSFNAVFPNLIKLGLSVNRLTEVPDVVVEHTLLQQLWLNNNSISELPSSLELPNLKILYLTTNRLRKFENYFPSLELLDLGYNNFTEIPPIVFNHAKLTELKLAGNNLRNISLTNEQASFFANLQNFSFDESSINKDCYVYQQREIHSMKFCIRGVTLSNTDDETSGGSGSSSSLTPIIIGVATGVVVLAAVIGFFVYRNQSRKSGNKSATTTGGAEATAASLNTTNAHGSISLWNDAALLAIKVNSEDIKDIKQIGKGAYGEVWLVRYCNTQLLASKRLRKTTANQSQSSVRFQDFVKEIKLVAKLEHPHIVAFVAVAWTLEADLQALFEYMDGGDLRGYLDSDYTPRYWTAAKVQIAIDIAEALVYVHSFNPPLVHRDLKSRNVLLSTALDAKLTDFGVSRYQSENNTMTSGVGTGRWLAPEVITGSTDYGAAADIFSFGAVLSELDTHRLPYDDVVGPNGNKLADVALLQLISTGQVRPTFRSASPERIVALAYRCFHLNPLLRPTATELAYALRNLKRDMTRGSSSQ